MENKFNLVIFVESAISLLNLVDICRAATSISDKSPFHLDGIVFGSDDFCADIGEFVEYFPTSYLFFMVFYLNLQRDVKTFN